MIFSGFELKESLIRLRTKSGLTAYDIAEYLGIEEEVVNSVNDNI